MSCYSTMSGHGQLSKKDFRELKNRLIEAYSQDTQGFKPAELKKYGVPVKATSRTHEFPLITTYTSSDGSGKEISVDGVLTLDSEVCTFHFCIDYDNHAVDRVRRQSGVFRALMHFLENWNATRKTYGAITKYYDEYMVDEDGMPTPPIERYYGSWKKPVSVTPRGRKRRKKVS